MSNPYDAAQNLKDINVTRLIPEGAIVDAAMSAPPEVKNTKPDGSGSDYIEATFTVRGGPFDGADVRPRYWMGTVVKEGKKRSAFQFTLQQWKELLFGYVPVPSLAMGADGKETPASQAARAPYLAKVDGFFKSCNDKPTLATRLGTLVGKTVRFRIGLEETPPKVEGGRPFRNNIIREVIPAATAQQPAMAQAA